MNSAAGMLWFDNDPKAALETKVDRAAAYYTNKYGRQPNLCYVHPSMLPVSDVQPDAAPDAQPPALRTAQGVELRAARAVMPHHFLLSVGGVS